MFGWFYLHSYLLFCKLQALIGVNVGIYTAILDLLPSSVWLWRLWARWKNLWAICAEDVGNYLRPSKQSRPAIGRLPNCSTNSRPGLNRIFLMVAAWLRLLGRILFQIWIQIFIQTNIFLFYFFSITSISNMFTYF